MKKTLRLTLITGIIFTLLISATGLTASASCPLTSLFNRGSGSPFGNFASFFGGGGSNSNAGSCPISKFFGNNMNFFNKGSNSSTNNSCFPFNNTANNSCTTNNCSTNNNCTTNNCNANNSCTTNNCVINNCTGSNCLPADNCTTNNCIINDCKGSNCLPADNCTTNNCIINNCTGSNCLPANNCPPANNCTTNNCPPANNDCSVNNTCPPEPDKPAEQPPQVCSTYAEEVLKYVNEARTSRGLSALKLDENLCAAAEVRATEVLRRFSHTRPDGTSCFTVLRDFGIGYRICGENIAKGFRDAQSVVNAWMNSSGHRANILNPSYTHMGVGKDGTGWGQLFIG